jgi:hypothetical protein
VLFQSEAERHFVADGNGLAITYEFTLSHRDGETWPEKPRQTGMAQCRNSKGGIDDKAPNKCHTAARKYFMLALFQIPTGDYDDADKDDAERPDATGKPAPLPKRDNPHVVRQEDTGEYQHRVDPATGKVVDCIPVYLHRAPKLLPSKPETRRIAEDLLKRMRANKTAADLVEFAEATAEEWAALPDKWMGHYQAEYQMLLDSLRKQQRAA